MKKICKNPVSLLLCLAPMIGATASATTVPFVSSGWYSPTASGSPSMALYFAGQYNSVQFLDFFTFDLTSLSGSFTGAALTITNRQDYPPPVSPNSSDTYSIFLSGDTVPALNAGVADYANVVTGAPLGSFSTDFNALTDGEQLMIPFNAEGLAAINSLVGNGVLALGGQVTTVTGGADDYLFVGKGGGGVNPLAGDVYLTLTTNGDPAVPEPATMIFVGSALLGLGAIRLRRRA